jgi:uncharacterized protein (TIGR02466 family)
MAAISQPETHFFFPTVLQVVKVPEAQSLNAKLMAAIEKLRVEYKDQGVDPWSEFFTTYNSQNRLYELPGFTELVGHIQREGDIFARTLGFDPAQPLYLTGCWLNVYGSGHSQDLHVHTGQVISGCYYVKSPPGVPGLSVFSPFAEEMFDVQTAATNPLNAKFIEVPAVEGEMLLFRSWTRHCVRPNRTDSERVSIAFNFSY